MTAFLSVAIVLLCDNFLAPELVKRYDRTVPRDPDSGIMIGAEPRTLGPETSPIAVLLVHGYLGGTNNLGELPDRLAAHGWRVRAMRVPGHGTSPFDLRRTTADEMIEAVRAELDALRAEHETVFLGGHSMGGALATIAAAQGDVDGLVLLAPYFGITYRWFYVLPAETWARLTAPVLPWFYKGRCCICVAEKENRDHIFSYPWVPARSAVTLFKIGRRANAPETLEHVTCPVLLIHSRNDRAASPRAAARALDAMAATDKRTLWLERSDHILCWDYDREQVNDAVEDFLDDLVHAGPSIPKS